MSERDEEIDVTGIVLMLLAIALQIALFFMVV